MTKSPGNMSTPACPVSATHGLVAASGVLAMIVGICLLRQFQPFDNIALSALVLVGSAALGVFVPDLLWQKVHRRALLALPQPADMTRVMIKFFGLAGSVGFIAFLYWVTPEYAKGDQFYRNYWEVLRLVLPVWLIAAVPYMYWVDRRMTDPCDSLWQVGCLVTIHWGNLHWGMIGQHLLGWVVKGYFLPLMFVDMCGSLGNILSYDFEQSHNFTQWYEFAFQTIFFFDVGLVSMTYLMTLRLTDTHIRSSEPSLLGWVVTLICYPPFTLVTRQYFDYETGKPWGSWISSDTWLYPAWGTLILVLLTIYLWATVAFGGRFSNLTHRGVITNGPYRYSKHPAYITKNLSWWCISMPFMMTTSLAETIRHCLLLLMVNGIYYLRAKTEERHLLLDPVYADYAAWIDAHGVLRFLDRVPLVGELARWRPEFGQRPLNWVWTTAASKEKGALPGSS
jgi:protein-S-isoprenylcysteine O-methyltransferase Ste14